MVSILQHLQYITYFIPSVWQSQEARLMRELNHHELSDYPPKPKTHECMFICKHLLQSHFASRSNNLLYHYLQVSVTTFSNIDGFSFRLVLNKEYELLDWLSLKPGPTQMSCYFYLSKKLRENFQWQEIKTKRKKHQKNTDGVAVHDNKGEDIKV